MFLRKFLRKKQKHLFARMLITIALLSIINQTFCYSCLITPKREKGVREPISAASRQNNISAYAKISALVATLYLI